MYRNDYRGPDEFLAFFERYRQAFPDMEITVDEAIIAGDTIAGRWSVKAAHRGVTLGVAATNRPVAFQGMSFAKVRNGQLVECWNVFDFAGMMKQVGGSITPGQAQPKKQ